MKLYGSYTSPYVRHCRVAMAQSDLDYEFIEVDYVMSAERSPTAKVPFLKDGDIMLTDSSSILKYIREQSGAIFLEDIQDFDRFALSNTLLDSTINLYLLENDGLLPDQFSYLKRQQNRINAGLKALNTRINPAQGVAQDSALRCACFIDWALFRKRFNIDGLDNLKGLLEVANQVEAFSSTAPPA